MATMPSVEEILAMMLPFKSGRTEKLGMTFTHFSSRAQTGKENVESDDVDTRNKHFSCPDTGAKNKNSGDCNGIDDINITDSTDSMGNVKGVHRPDEED